jgi:hypothetical protein
MPNATLKVGWDDFSDYVLGSGNEEFRSSASVQFQPAPALRAQHAFQDAVEVCFGIPCTHVVPTFCGIATHTLAHVPNTSTVPLNYRRSTISLLCGVS